MSIPNVLIYVLYYDEASKIMAETTCLQAVGSLVPKKMEPHPLFESQFYLTNHAEKDWFNITYVGTIAYNYHERLGIAQGEVWQSISDKIDKALGEDSDVIVFNNAPDNIASIADEGKAGHGELFKLCWIGLLARLGYKLGDIVDSRHPVCYNNYWLAKVKVMQDYCAFIQRAWKVLLESPDLLTLFDADAQWNSRLTAAQLMKIFNKPYYAMYPFVFERFCGFYLSSHGYRIFLCKKTSIVLPEPEQNVIVKTVKTAHAAFKNWFGPVAIVFGIIALIVAIYTILSQKM